MKPFRRHPSGEHEPVAAHGSETRLRTASRAGTGEQHSPGYARIHAILLKYLSPILVESVLQKSVQSRHLSPETLNAAALAEVTGDIMVGLRLFVPPERLPRLMLELADVLDLEHP
jgi:hypothetical protein